MSLNNVPRLKVDATMQVERAWATQHTIHRRIVAAHNGGSVEIVWETIEDGTQRIAIYSGPDSVIVSTHVSMQLPPETIVPPENGETSVMVLSYILKQQVLCCLIHPELVILFDIFPDDKNPALIPGEGWQIPLPFHCQGIFALQDSGLLLHRKEDNSEQTLMDPPSWKNNFHHQVPAPPFASPQLLPNSSGNNALSLFSFHHPLEEILPVSARDFDPQHIIWTEADLMLAVGKQGQVSIYRVRNAPPPPEPAPLYETIKETYDTTPQQGEAKLLLSDAAGPSLQPQVTRNEALADALGVSPQTTKKQHRPSYSPPGPEPGTATADITHHSIMLAQSLSSSLRPRIAVKLLHEDAMDEGVSNVFLVVGLHKERILAIQDGATLKLYTVESNSVTPRTKIPCYSAQPIHTINDAVDLLVLYPQGQLHLLRGDHCIARCDVVPSLSSPITQLLDPVGGRCSIQCKNRAMIRVHLSLATLHHEQLILALETVLSPALLLSVRLNLQIAPVRRVLAKLAKAILGVETQGQVLLPPTRTNSAWDQLLQSDYHKTYERSGRRRRLGAPSSSSHHQECDSIKFDTTGTSFPNLVDVLQLFYEECKLSGDNEKMHELLTVLVDCCDIHASTQPTPHVESSVFLAYYNSEMGKLQPSVTNSSEVSNVKDNDEISFSAFSSPFNLIQWVESKLLGSNTGPYSNIDPSQLNDAFRKTRTVLGVFKRKDIIIMLLEEGFKRPSDFVKAFPPCVAWPVLNMLHSYLVESRSVDEYPAWPAKAWELVGRTDLAANAQPPAIKEKAKDEENAIVEDSDGLKVLERDSVILFPDDNRVREAAKLLCSSQPISLRVDRPIEVSDHDYERLKQKRLLLMVCRSVAFPVGRGMLTLGGLKCPSTTSKLTIPEICMKGKVPPSNATINLDTSECPADLLVWPYFHNGVAAGLRLPAAQERSSNFKATRTWIRYNRPAQPDSQDGDNNDSAARLHQNHSHAGFLLALGLRGNLASLEMSDLYEYLTEGSITTTVGLVLGIAANKRGSCDMSVSKMISLHIPSLIPQHFSAIDVASPVQAAAVTASGILFQSSSHRMMTEFLLNEIGKRPDTDVSTVDREAYSLACGLALGTVNLCHGEATGASDRGEGLADLRIEERLIRYIVGGVDPDEERRKQESNDRFSLRTGAAVGDSDRCSTVYEGPEINSVMCAPGAILALGLMYMKTGNQSIASALALPETHFLLEFIRPDFLGLLVISRSLVLWSDVKATSDWIEDQIPGAVSAARLQMRSTTMSAAYGIGSTTQHRDFDQTAVRRMYAHIIAGACFGMGLRYAGTANIGAKVAILKRITELTSLRNLTDPVSAVLRPEIPILDSCIGTAAISVAMVMAGTGDLDVLRQLRVLRWRCEADSSYGIHMIFAMSIGLLFLGGCTCTLGREPEDIAALVTAFFPMFPVLTAENHFHLQAVRHLYVLAVKKRLVRTIDVDSGLDVEVPIQVISDSHQVQLRSPSLLPFSEDPWNELVVLSEKHRSLVVKLDFDTVPDAVYVKALHTSYELSGINVPIVKDLTALATESDLLKSFAEYVVGKEALTSLKARSLVESLTSTDEMLLLYLTLMNGSDRFKAWNLRVMRSASRGTQGKLPAMMQALQEQMVRRMEELVETDAEAAEVLFNDCYGLL